MSSGKNATSSRERLNTLLDTLNDRELAEVYRAVKKELAEQLRARQYWLDREATLAADRMDPTIPDETETTSISDHLKNVRSVQLPEKGMRTSLRKLLHRPVTEKERADVELRMRQYLFAWRMNQPHTAYTCVSCGANVKFDTPTQLRPSGVGVGVLCKKCLKIIPKRWRWEE